MSKSFSPAAVKVSSLPASSSKSDGDDDHYVCQLDAATEEKAKKELNEDPKDRLNAVQALRTWLQQQPHITLYTDTVTLLGFLRTAKFSQLKAREMIEKFATVITETPRWFKHVDTTDPSLLQVFEIGHALVLPKKDKNGSRLLLYRFGRDDTKLSVEQEIRSVSVVEFLAIRDENVQVNGFVFIMDFSGFSLKHVTKWTMDDSKKWSNIWQNCMPGRFKAFHYYNVGPVFETFMAIARTVLSKKMQDRIFVHDTLESLYKHIDMELLPTEYLPDDYKGPSAGSMEQVTANFKREITEPSFREYLLERTSDRYGIDASKKPAFKAVNESFRKLAVD